MAGVPFKGGLVPVGNLSASPYTGQILSYQMEGGSDGTLSAAAYTGQLMKVDANGFLEPVAAGDGVGDFAGIVGVAVGFFWVDPTSKQPVFSNYAAAGQSTADGDIDGVRLRAANNNSSIGVKIAPATPDALFAIKSEDTVGVTGASNTTGLGQFANLKNNDAGSTVNGRSSAVADMGSATSANSELRIVNVLRTEDYIAPSDSGGTLENYWGEAETVVIVKLTGSIYMTGYAIGAAATPSRVVADADVADAG